MGYKESRRTWRHDDSLCAPTVPPYLRPHGEIAAPMSEWATAYADLGFPVLPLVPGTKRPATRHGLRDATTDGEQVATWWRQSPRANIGLACGVVADVADFDVKVRLDGTVDRSSRDGLRRLNERGLLASAAGIVLTRHGGWQVYYPPSGEGVHHLPKAAIDFLGSGAYAVAPPSQVPVDNGYRGLGYYTWLRFPDFDAPAVAPVPWQVWLRLLAPERLTPRALPHAQRPHAGTAGLTRTVATAGEGGRNNVTYWALCRALSVGLPIDDICRAAVDAGLPVAEVQGIVASARRRVVVSHV